MNLISECDWEALSKEFESAPFPSICIDNFLTEEFLSEVVDSYPGFSEAQQLGLDFNKVNEKGKVQVTDSQSFPDAVKKLAQALSSPQFTQNIEKLSKIDNLIWDPSYHGAGMHLTKSTGHLDVHVDFNYSESLQMHRRINLLLYLNKTWDQDWGGQLELWDEKVKSCFRVVTPALNRCVIFATSNRSFHGVRAVTCPADTTRNSFAVYYYTKEPPDGWKGEKHSTIFRARPEEKLKKYVYMPIEALRNSYFFQKANSLRKRLF